MPVPETTVYEYHRAIPWQDKIGPTRQRPHMQPVPKSASVQKLANRELRSRITRADPCHHATPDRSRHDVGHGYIIDLSTNLTS